MTHLQRRHGFHCGTHVWQSVADTGCGPGLPGSLVDIDTGTGSVGTVPLPAGESYVAADGQQLWLATPAGVYRIGQ